MGVITWEFLFLMYVIHVWMQFRVIVAAEFVKDNSWPELIPELQSVIRNSDLIIEGGDTDWKTINALTVLHSLIRPFQVLNTCK